MMLTSVCKYIKVLMQCKNYCD